MIGEITVFHKTVQGNLHILSNVPCEDYSASFSDKNGQYHIIAIADGHGASACMRSAYGSKAVVEITLNCLKDFAESFLSKGMEEILSGLSAPRTVRQAMKQLTDTIISRWYQQIREHLKLKPLTEKELSKAGPYEKNYREGNRLEHVYGTTLIAALWLPEYLILLQQGDGRCDVFFEDGTVEQPIPWDDRCFQNVTTSMCDEDVASSIRHSVISFKARPVMACYMGSDGVEDAFRDMEGTHTFYRKLSNELVCREQMNFEQYLDEMMPKFSEKGSKDDISIAGIVNIKAVKPFLPLFLTLSQKYELLDAKRYYDEKIHSMTRKHDILRKRKERAQNNWKQLNERLQLMQKYSSCLQTIVTDLSDRKQTITDTWEQYQTAEAEFSEYDKKYQNLLKAQQDIKSQIDDFSLEKTEV